MENVCLPCLDRCRKRSLLICRRTSLVRGILSPSETHSEYINFMDLRNPSHAYDKAGKVRSSWLWNLGHMYQKYKQHVSNPTKNDQWPLICKAISTPFQKCKTVLRKISIFSQKRSARNNPVPQRLRYFRAYGTLDYCLPPLRSKLPARHPQVTAIYYNRLAAINKPF